MPVERRNVIELVGILIYSVCPKTGELVNAYTDESNATYATIAVSHNDTVLRDFWVIKVANKDNDEYMSSLQKKLLEATANEYIDVIGEPYIEMNPKGKVPIVRAIDLVTFVM